MSYLDMIGYLASVIVLISLLMSSILKLRWINLVGALIFCVYGFMIQSLPTGFLNLGIVFIDAWYILKIYRTKEALRMMPLSEDAAYTAHFLDFYRKDMARYFSSQNLQIEPSDFGFYVLRNMVPASLFVASPQKNVLRIKIDYATPAYRDFKISNFIFEDCKAYFLAHGFDTFYAHTLSKKHEAYLLKMGFQKSNEKGDFIKKIAGKDRP